MMIRTRMFFTVLQGAEGVPGRPGAPGEKVSPEQSPDHNSFLCSSFQEKILIILFLCGSYQGGQGPVGPAGLPGLDGAKGEQVSRHKEQLIHLILILNKLLWR